MCLLTSVCYLFLFHVAYASAVYHMLFTFEGSVSQVALERNMPHYDNNILAHDDETPKHIHLSFDFL